MEHEITYERDIQKSYMKIPAVERDCFDEKVIVGRKIEGTNPCKKCFVNNEAEYWYDISGKQGLDEFCKVNEIEKHLFEKIILGICNCLETLEWNLIDANCLMLRPDLIFIDVRRDEVLFVLYPECEENIYNKLQGLMEFLLTKINHEDMALVSYAYCIYEQILQGTYAIGDIKQILLDKKMETVTVAEPIEIEAVETALEIEENVDGVDKTDDMIERIKILFDRVSQRLSEAFIKKKKQEEVLPEVVYPEEIGEEKTETVLHPTVCLSNWKESAQGLLLYEGKESFADFEIGQSICIVGKSHRVKLQIEKDTISQFHAKIEWMGDVYYIEDMNSTNGTYVNEELLNYKEKRTLTPGDSIRFADVKYRFM